MMENIDIYILRWIRHIKNRKKEKTRSGRPSMRWLDRVIECDMKTAAGVNEVDAGD